MEKHDPLGFFKLKPVEAAKVSEISEATAFSPVPVEERVNFHIGNPVQDEELHSMYLRLALGLNVTQKQFGVHNPSLIIEALDLPSDHIDKVDFFSNLIKESAPYSPRGGFIKSRPNRVIQYFNEWLTKQQAEPLSYDPGDASGKREIILSSGGVCESLRILFHSIAGYLINVPCTVFYFGIDLPDHLRTFPNIFFEKLDTGERDIVGKIDTVFKRNSRPSFLILGRTLPEETRRQLRNFSLRHPLYFIEVNDAPNHHSLAREAKMMNRVLRIITPGVFLPELRDFSLVFVAGNSDFLKVIEAIHFQLKGTPSSSEIVLLDYLLKNLRPKTGELSDAVSVDAEYEGQPDMHGLQPAAKFVHAAEDKMETLIRQFNERIEHTANNISKAVERYTEKVRHLSARYSYDHFSEADSFEMLDTMQVSMEDDEWINDLMQSFITVFLSHHPKYSIKNTLVVSGSSRTALGLLGFHCGIREVIIPDLSWTYEHCFPEVCAVPLTDEFQIDVGNLKSAVIGKINKDANWKKYGAVVINNPHNATGQIFNGEKLKNLLAWLLEQKIFVIDDLSYQNVVPGEDFREISTLRQLSDELVKEGYVSDENADYLITVHSLSKTDSYAGARLSVVEIRNEELYTKFKQVNDTIKQNIGAIFLAYLFYRNKVEDIRAYYKFRNRIFNERSNALVEAVTNLPAERNRFFITISAPSGSMYPQMKITNLPRGLSLDWLASGLARQGIGLIPLSTFSRTEKGYDTARNTFRLTLGGTDGPDTLSKKTRRVLIDLNRMIAEESSSYNRKEFNIKGLPGRKKSAPIDFTDEWKIIESKIMDGFESAIKATVRSLGNEFNSGFHRIRIQNEFLPYKLSLFRQRFLERQSIANDFAHFIYSGNGKRLQGLLEREFYKDDLTNRKTAFRHRMYDRTVHPTQMYSMKTELLFETLVENLLRNKKPDFKSIDKIRSELVREYFGQNVAIASGEEPQELILDLNAVIAAENYMMLHSDGDFEPFISFWGDWDGSNRPSGQGHSLVAFVLIENIIRQARIIQSLLHIDKSLKIDPELLVEIDSLPKNNRRFSELLKRISHLTQQLEQRYRGTLPFNLRPGTFRQIGMKLHIARDPLMKMWYHNDRLERKMLDMRKERRTNLEYYFSLNKKLRKTLYEYIPSLISNISHTGLLLEAGLYRDLLKRFVVTPRINEKLITAQDQFAIDTTVHNINEINEIAGSYGNPGMVLALQVSMTTKPEALISLDRKLLSGREEILRRKESILLPNVWIIPLFEDHNSVKGISAYLDKVWDYAVQSRRLSQEKQDRFTEIVAEIFVAGSDLSQQVGQPTAMNLFLESKFELLTWLASHNLIGRVRMKMGSGEPMQRQGGYYSYVAGKQLFINSRESETRLSGYLRDSTKKSTEYATTPLLGIFAGGDLRTFQSNLSEKLRYLPVADYSQLLFHVRESQKFNEREIVRAGEPLSETRLQFKTRGLQELERLTVGRRDSLFNEFLGIHKDNFRHILYGREEDVVGIHVISYFIGRTTPQLRDRPTERPGGSPDNGTGRRILEKIARTIPLSSYGSLLRAISHNQSQSVILGINQLTTGLFRALNNFSQKEFADNEPTVLISERILPKLPVYEILQSLRLYHDVSLTYLHKLEKAYPAGNSALIALREDIDSMQMYLPIFRKELLRRHGLDVSEFFNEDRFVPNLLPTVRPDLAVLLQDDLFNTSLDVLISETTGNIDKDWLSNVDKLLAIPGEIRGIRRKIWDLLEEPVFQRVSGFVELAIALYPLTVNPQQKEYLFSSREFKTLPRFTQSGYDDNMQQFLSAAMEYVSALSQSMVEVPINIVRALKEIERIIKIEEQALTVHQQDLLRFYLLQIARITGENG